MKTTFYFVIVLCLSLLSACRGEETKAEAVRVDTLSLVMQVKECARLYTAEYEVHKLVLKDDPLRVKGNLFQRAFDVKVPIGERKVMIPLDVTLKAYIDFTGFDEKNVLRSGDRIVPLLCVNREDIIHYLESIGQDYVTDSTNLEDEYTRNKIRLNLLPLIQEINPSVKKNLIDTSNYLNDVATIYNKCIEESKNNIVTTEGIRISELVKEPAPEAILFEILHPLGFNSAQIKDIAFSLHSQPGKQFCSKKWRVIKDREFLLIEAIESGNEILLPFQIIKEEKEYTPDFLIPRDKGIACFDADKLNGDIHYRKWQTGDTFIPFGMKGKKKISDYLTDRKFSISQKERQWVLCCGEHIAWLIGERTDNRFRIDETTKRVVIYKIV